MKEILSQLDRQILDGHQLGSQFKPSPFKGIQKIVFSGMGGSAISGDILRLLVRRYSKFNFQVNRAGELPRSVDAKTLVILSSYSGNSIEILRTMPDLLKSKAKILVVSAGGKLSEIAQQKKLLWLQVPSGLMPRCAIGYMTFSLLPVFKKWGMIQYSFKDVEETALAVRKTSLKEAKHLAGRLHSKLVYFYGSGLALPVMTRWRTQWAENAKMLACQQTIPEMFHNEIEAWHFPRVIIQNAAAVFFKDQEDHAWLKNKTKAAQEMIRKSGAEVIVVASKGRSVLARLFSLIALGDWVSYELAALNGVDPMAIPRIEALKKVF